MKKILIAFALGSLLLASCGGKHDCVCTSSETRDGVAETEDKSNTVKHDQKDDCSSFNTTETDKYTDWNSTTNSTVDVTRVTKTTCVED